MAAAGIAVSVSMGVMKPVLEKLSTLMGDKFKKIKGLRKEVSFLRDELRAMDALLEKMDRADRLDSQAKEWRKDIIDMSYDIEDCIDDFMHCVGEAGNRVGLLQKASGFLRTIKDRYRIANQIKKIKTHVIQASTLRRRYKFDEGISNTNPVVEDPRLSILCKDSTTLVGIDTQKEELSKWVNDEEQQLKIMSIVGFGGLGKTTLANEVYRQVEGQFNCKVNVCVSQNPDINKVLKRILLQLGERQYSDSCLERHDLVYALSKHLEDKRYFIVLDDLWEIKAWDDIQCAFPQNNYCSRVMITTRNDEVAKRCCGNSGIIHNMKPLSEPDSRKLFFTRIFGSQNDCPSEFKEVSCAILNRCGGLPLAILTVAGILASQNTNLRGAWEYIRTELALQVETNDIDYEKMMDILDLSYKHLPRHLKACFLYFGTYPEDDIIKKAELVRRWVAEGFVSASTEQNVWDVGESYLNELVNRSVIQPAYREDEFLSSYRVHDMMLDLIIRKCKEDNFLSFINGPEAMASAVKDKVLRRLTVDLRDIDQGGPMLMTTAAGNLSHVRSFTMFNYGSTWSIPLFLELKFVRVLWLRVRDNDLVVLFGIINRLSHLRYLKVLGYRTMELTTEIRALRLLETLDLSGLHLFNSSLDLVDLPRLSHLSMAHGCALPRGIAEMKQMRTLSGIRLPSSSSESIQGLGELTGLTELSLVSKLSPAMATWMVALCTSLEKLGKLKLLEVAGSSGFTADCADPLSLLSPPFGSSLERLNVFSWTFTNIPRWVGHLQCLQELNLGAKQIIQQDVAIIGMLPKLIKLKLRIVHVPTTRIVIGGGGLFSLVKEFQFDCDGISSLTFEAEAMPSLGRLNLAFDIHQWDRATPEGLQHLSCLKQIHLHSVETFIKKTRSTMDCEADAALMMSVFQETVDASFLTRPELTCHTRGYIRMREVEDYFPLI